MTFTMSENKVIRPYVSKRKRQIAEKKQKEENVKKLAKVDVKNFFVTDPRIWELTENPKQHLPKKIRTTFKVSDSPIWCAKWCKKFSHLVAVTVDDNINLYNAMEHKNHLKYVISNHNGTVKFVDWSKNSRQIATCAYDKTVKVFDFFKDGSCTTDITLSKYPNIVKWWPNNPYMLVVAGDKDLLMSFDVRTGKEAVNYPTKSGNILSIDFFSDGETFVSSGDSVSRESPEHSITVWDTFTGAKLSNQIYHERYSCPCVKTHSSNSAFLAQSNGNYIARFSTQPPFRMDKNIRYEKHKVEGFPVQFDISPEAGSIASGSSDGQIYFYQYKTSALLYSVKISNSSIVDVSWHPKFRNLLCVTDWNGRINIVE